jgi:hypothetical protein
MWNEIVFSVLFIIILQMEINILKIQQKFEQLWKLVSYQYVSFRIILFKL